MSESEESLGILNEDDLDIELIGLPDIPDCSTFRSLGNSLFETSQLFTFNRLDTLTEDSNEIDKNIENEIDKNNENEIVELIDLDNYLLQFDVSDDEENPVRSIQVVIENAREEDLLIPVHHEPEKTYYMDDDDDDDDDSPRILQEDIDVMSSLPEQTKKFILPDIFNAETEVPNYERSAKIAKFIDDFLYRTILGNTEQEIKFSGKKPLLQNNSTKLFRKYSM